MPKRKGILIRSSEDWREDLECPVCLGTTEIHRVTQTRTDLDRPGQTRTDFIKRTFGTLFGTLKDLWDQCRSFLDTKLDPFGTFKVLLDQLRDFTLYYSNYFTLSHSSELRP